MGLGWGGTRLSAPFREVLKSSAPFPTLWPPPPAHSHVRFFHGHYSNIPKIPQGPAWPVCFLFSSERGNRSSLPGASSAYDFPDSQRLLPVGASELCACDSHVREACGRALGPLGPHLACPPQGTPLVPRCVEPLVMGSPGRCKIFRNL